MTIVIPAAGLGSRLHEFTKNYSKAMCTIGPKPIFSYIIENFKKDDEIIILLGYKGELLKEAITACYPDWNITFITVDKYEGEGSGLGYSLSCARELLQKPFVFWSCDTILNGFRLEDFNFNTSWIVCSYLDANNYLDYRHAHIKPEDRSLLRILPKTDLSEKSDVYPYVGVSFIKEFDKFWEPFYKDRDSFTSAGEVLGINNICGKYPVTVYKTTDCGMNWLDTGNYKKFTVAKDRALSEMDETILEKPDETIWLFNDKVIKFHIDEKFIADRVERKFINDRQCAAGCDSPKIIHSNKNTYTMERCQGEVVSKIVTPKKFIDILERFCGNYTYAEKNEKAAAKFVNDFYKDKTLSRIRKFCKDSEEDDVTTTINDLECLPAKDFIENLIDWDKVVASVKMSPNCHGDFHLENIMYDEANDKYWLLDWRQNFGESFVGDIYYDLSKMMHSLIVNHNKVRANQFDVKTLPNNGIKFDIDRTFIDIECEEILRNFIESNGFDIKLTELLTALIFLNICACHIWPYSRFLYYLGRYMIQKCYDDLSNLYFIR